MDLFTIGLVFTAIDKMSGAVKGMCNNSISDLNRVQEKLRNMSETMNRIGRESMGAGLMITGALAQPIKAFADLEEKQKELKTTMMDSTGVVGNAYQKTLDLSKDLGIELAGSTGDYVNEMIALREQGVQVEAMLGGVAKSAAHFGMIMHLAPTEAAMFAAKFRESLGIADSDMGKMMDKMQRLKYASGLRPDELLETYRYLGPTLKNIRIQGLGQLDDLNAMLGVFARQGMEGSQVGTNLAMAFQRIAQVGQVKHRGQIFGKAEEILETHHISLDFWDKKGEFAGIRNMTKELEKIKDLTSREKMLLGEGLFGEQGGRMLTLLAQGGEQALNDMLDRMKKQADMQMKIQEITSGTVMQWKILSGTGKTFLAELGMTISETLHLGAAMGSLNNILGKMIDWVDAHKKLAGAIGAVVAVAGAALVVIGGTLLVLGTATRLLAGGIGAVGTFTKYIQIAIPWVRLKAAEVLRLAGYQRMLDAIQYRGGFWNAMQYWLMTTKLRILEAVGAVRTWTVAQLAAFRANFLTIGGLQNMARAFGTTLLAGLRAAIVGVRAFSIALFTTPIGWISVAIAGAAFLIYKFWGPISGFFRGLWTGLKEGLKGLEPAWNIFKKFSFILTPIIWPLKMIYSLIKWLIAPVNDTGKAAENLGVRFGRAIGGILSLVLTLPYKMLSAGANIVNSLYQGMMSMINKPIEAVKSLAQRIRNHLPFSPAKEGPLSDLHKVNIIGTIAGAMKPGPMVDAMRMATERMKQAMQPVKPSTPMPLVQTVTQKMQAARMAMQPLLQPVRQVIDPIRAIASPLVNPVRTMPVTEAMKKSAASKQLSGSPVVITYNPTVNITGAATERDRQDFSKLLQQHKDEIMRLIENHGVNKERMAW